MVAGGVCAAGGGAFVPGWEACASTPAEDVASATPPSRIAGAQSRITHEFIIVVCVLPNADRIKADKDRNRYRGYSLQSIAFASVLYRDFDPPTHSPEDN